MIFFISCFLCKTSVTHRMYFVGTYYFRRPVTAAFHIPLGNILDVMFYLKHKLILIWCSSAFSFFRWQFPVPPLLSFKCQVPTVRLNSGFCFSHQTHNLFITAFFMCSSGSILLPHSFNTSI